MFDCATLLFLQTSVSPLDTTTGLVLLVVLVAIVGVLGYLVGVYLTRMSGADLKPVSLEEVVIRGEYSIPFDSIKPVEARLTEHLNFGGLIESWSILTEGNTIEMMEKPVGLRDSGFLNRKKAQKAHIKGLTSRRPGLPFYLRLICHPAGQGETVADVSCRPVLYYRMTQLGEYRFPRQQVEEAQGECSEFVRKVMVGVLEGRELKAPSIRSATKDNEATDALRRLGMTMEVGLLDEARDKMAQGHPEDAVKDCRTVLERAAAKATERVGGKTNSFENDLRRLESKGQLTGHTAQFLRALYGYLSGDVHGEFKADSREGGLSVQAVESAVLFLLA